MGHPWIFAFLAGLLLLRGIAGREPACELMENGRRRQHKVLVFVDGEYFALFHNWVLHFNRTCGGDLSNLELACMDSLVAERLPGLNMSLRCSESFQDVLHSSQPSISDRVGRVGNRVSGVWLKRFQIVIRLLQSQYDVILSDTDALWLQNPYPTLSRFTATSAIVSSRGWFPHSIAKRWGSTICMGFIYLRAVPDVVSFLQLVFGDMRGTQQTFRAYWEWFSSAKQNSSAADSVAPLSSSPSTDTHTISRRITHARKNSSCASAGVVAVEEEKDKEANEEEVDEDGAEESKCPPSTGIASRFSSKWQEYKRRTRKIPFNESLLSLNLSSFPTTKEGWQQVDVREADDQYSINMVLQSLHTVFPQNMTKTYKTHAHTTLVSTPQNVSSSTSSPFSFFLTLLPEDRFVRNCVGESVSKIDRTPIPTKKVIATVNSRTQHATIAHCLLAPGNSVIKEHYMVIYGLWHLPGNVSASYDALRQDAKKKLIERMERTRRNSVNLRGQLPAQQNRQREHRWSRTNEMILASQDMLWEKARRGDTMKNASVNRPMAMYEARRKQRQAEKKIHEAKMEAAKHEKLENNKKKKEEKKQTAKRGWFGWLKTWWL